MCSKPEEWDRSLVFSKPSAFALPIISIISEYLGHIEKFIRNRKSYDTNTEKLWVDGQDSMVFDADI